MTFMLILIPISNLQLVLMKITGTKTEVMKGAIKCHGFIFSSFKIKRSSWWFFTLVQNNLYKLQPYCTSCHSWPLGVQDINTERKSLLTEAEIGRDDLDKKMFAMILLSVMTKIYNLFIKELKIMFSQVYL